jgi:hypothetical protein
MKTILSFLITCALASSAFAQGAPATVSFAARLQDSGQALTGNHDFVFALFDAPTAGTNLWQETRTGVAVQDGGLLYLDLGSVTPLSSTVFGGNARYLEITIDGVVSSPRVLIESVPYSLRSAKAYDAEGLQGHGASFFQQAVASTCTGTSSIQTVNADGTVTCTTGPAYTAGTGLALAGGIFSADFTMTQARVGGACATGAINAVLANGSVTCAMIPSTAGGGISATSLATGTIAVDFTTVQHAVTGCSSGLIVNGYSATGTPTCYAAGTGLTFNSGTNAWDVNTTTIQQRVTGTCTGGQAIASIGANGSVACAGASGGSGIVAARIDTSETTNSTTYADLATTGPSAASVTIGSSGAALVTVTGHVQPPASNTTAFMSFAATGAMAVAAVDTQALVRDFGSSGGTGFVQASATFYVTGLTPGTYTFTAKYRTTGGTATFANRNIIVQPL